MKALVLLAARGGSRNELDDELVNHAQSIARPGIQVAAFSELRDDPFSHAASGIRPYDATLELRGEQPDIAASVDGLADRFEPFIHADLSCALGGEDLVFIECDPAPMRYQYVMRRKIGTTHQEYLDYYTGHGERFGHRTGGIEGYVQFRSDPELSRTLANTAGLGQWQPDSVSELHLLSLEHFFEGLALNNPGNEPAEDEERFMDRANSVMFVSEVLWRSDEPEAPRIVVHP